MPLTNRQYDALLREYEEKQDRSRRRQLQKKEEVYQRIPEYEELENSISSIAVSQGMKLLNGDEHALEELHAKLRELSERRLRLLEAAGFPGDYLDPEYECPLCRDTGYVDSQKCRCFREKITSLLYEQSNIKEILRRENFSSFSYEFYQGEDLERIKNTAAACRNFIRDFHKVYKNILFYGNTGAGKTFLSNCIARELIEAGNQVLYFSAGTLFSILSENTMGRSRELPSNTNQEIYHCDLLLIDDLGTEYTNAYGVSQLFTCLNERYLRKKPTVISTNLSLEDLRNRYSERIFSRLTTNYDIYKVTGPDIRIYKKTMLSRK